MLAYWEAEATGWYNQYLKERELVDALDQDIAALEKDREYWKAAHAKTNALRKTVLLTAEELLEANKELAADNEILKADIERLSKALSLHENIGSLESSGPHVMRFVPAAEIENLQAEVRALWGAVLKNHINSISNH